MQRSPKGSGIPVDPNRVREARLAAGLSLGQVARDDVSRTFLLFVEQGKSRPSKRVLDLIAKRTRRPVSYFLSSASDQEPLSRSRIDLASDLVAVAGRVRRLASQSEVKAIEREALKLLELNIRQGAALARAIGRNPSASREPIPLAKRRRQTTKAS